MSRTNSKRIACGVAGFLTAICLASPAFALATLPEPSLPNGTPGSINIAASGTATIANSGNVQTYAQSTASAIVDYSKYNVGSTETVNMINNSSAPVMHTLARIHDANPSTIFGTINNPNGILVLANGNGLSFKNGSHVNVGGLIATTGTVSGANFNNISISTGSTSTVSNAGAITATGLVALVAPNVVNEKTGVIAANVVNLVGSRSVINRGAIHADGGKVNLAAVDMYNDGLLYMETTGPINDKLVQNKGQIIANGGQVALTAGVATDVVNNLINMTGLIQADTVDSQDGKVVLAANGSNGVVDFYGTDISGRDFAGEIYARGEDAGETGGTVDIIGQKEIVYGHGRKNAVIDTRGVVYGVGKGQIRNIADTITGDHVDFFSNDDVAFEPYSKDRTIAVGGGVAGQLQLSGDLLHGVKGDVVDGVQLGSITIGNLTDTGLMRVSGFTWNKNARLLNGTGDIRILFKQKVNYGHTFLANTDSGNIVMGLGGMVVANPGSVGTPVILAASGGNFINNRGADAIQVGKAARWLVYTKAPTIAGGGNFYNGLDSGNTAIWNTTYPTDVTLGGNRYVFAYQPLLTITLGDLSKFAGQDFTTQVANDWPPVSVTGLQPAEPYAYLADTFTATPIITSAGSPPPAPAGAYPINLAGGMSISDNGDDGYNITVVPGTLTVNPLSINNIVDRSKAPARRGPNGTLLSIVNTPGYLAGLAPAAGGVPGNLADLSPKAGGDTTDLANLSPQAGAGASVTPLIQCNETTPCDINQ